MDNRWTSLALVCPITSHIKGYPFEVGIPHGLPVSGVVLANHAESADWQARAAHFSARAPEHVMAEVTAKLRPLLRM
ncbi:MAG: type II toxin-antitoxin system PemK/MazF family toxin [Deltaproteobacteria bacterium]|nr:type II toxin-antitoxin system PemK/MazF family toxin [Deltaproteobacteria bacterium]MBI3389819.1 type II toxin-antitoxin system PemK/MazF family toxin [Deltaproteobacteria bacterium]